MKVVALGAAMIILLAGLIALSALVIMLLVNVVLSHYGATTLNYASSLAIATLFTLYVGAGFRSKK